MGRTVMSGKCRDEWFNGLRTAGIAENSEATVRRRWLRSGMLLAYPMVTVKVWPFTVTVKVPSHVPLP